MNKRIHTHGPYLFYMRSFTKCEILIFSILYNVRETLIHINIKLISTLSLNLQHIAYEYN